MKLTIGLNDIFDCPEGKYRVVLEREGEPKKPVKKACRNQVRLTFRTKTGKEYLVARTFCADLSYGSELYNFLETWLGGNLDRFADENGEIDLSLLIGKEADVLIRHDDPGTHPKPLVCIAAIFPPGTLVTE